MTMPKGDHELNQEALRSLFDAIHESVCLMSRDGIVLAANATFASRVGKRVEDCVGQSIYGLIPAALAARRMAIVEEVVRSRQPTTFEDERQGRWLLHSITPVLDAEGAVDRIAVYALDITERKRAEEALRQSEERYSRTLNAVNDGLWDWHIPSGEAFFSALYYTMLGYEDGAFPATYAAWRVLVHPEDIDRVERELQKSVETGSGFSIDLRMRNKTSLWLWVSTRGKVIERDTDGKALRIVGILSDITERKRAEAEREKLELQNRQLQKAESLGRMAGAIAHHFNNQLQAVTLNLEMARRELAAKAGPADRLAEAMQSARKAAEVSGLMLTYLGVTVGQTEPMDLADACRRCLPLLRTSAPRSVALEADMPSPGPVTRANASQVQQVLTNLATNAWEAGDEGHGAVRLAVGMVSALAIPVAHRFPIDWQPRDPAYACLEVADSGGGIPERDIEKIFDPFFSTKFTGRGMGLAVVLGIVRSYQGGLTVESKPGRGSVFRVFFPVTAEAVPRPPDQPPQGPAFHGSGTVLLVEDEPFVRQVVAKALASVGFAVLVAKDGEEAVELFRQRQAEICLVLSDLTMPRMDGWETMAALRQLAPDLPVILSSGYNEARVMAGHHAEQPQAFLSKPYEYDELIGAITQVLAKGKDSPRVSIKVDGPP